MDSQVIKARSFLGIFTIRNGLFVLALLQIGIGFAAKAALGYLRPSLHHAAWGFAIIFVASALIGMVAAYQRVRYLEIIYLLTFILCTILLFMLSLDFTGIRHFLPKPAVGASSGILRTFKFNPSKDQLAALELQREATFIRVVQHESPSLYDMPHPEAEVKDELNKITKELPIHSDPNETEGESEEVSMDELPPEVKNLSPEQQNQIIAMSKMAKRPIKMALGIVMMVLTVFMLYGMWIIITFIMNKCTSLDELVGQPEQFRPLVDQ